MNNMLKQKINISAKNVQDLPRYVNIGDYWGFGFLSIIIFADSDCQP